MSIPIMCCPTIREDILAVTDYHGPVTAIVGRNRIFGMQFHPEKSGTLGRELLDVSPPSAKGGGDPMSFILYPAMDLRGGKCVRLYQGDYGAETVYDEDPVRVARNVGERREPGGCMWSIWMRPARGSRSICR